MPLSRSAPFIHNAFLLNMPRQGSIYNFLLSSVRPGHLFCRFYIGLYRVRPSSETVRLRRGLIAVTFVDGWHDVRSFREDKGELERVDEALELSWQRVASPMFEHD